MEQKSNQNLYSITIAIFLASTLYAIIRYNIFNDVGWSDLPLYVLNKIISMTSVILLAIALGAKRRNSNIIYKRILKNLRGLIFIHLIISLLILTPAYFPKFFDDDKLNTVGQLSMLAGVFALFQMNNTRYIKLTQIGLSINFYKRYGFEILMVLISLHLFIMGYSSWLEMSRWPGGLPPISLLSFIITLLPHFVKEKARVN